MHRNLVSTVIAATLLTGLWQLTSTVRAEDRPPSQKKGDEAAPRSDHVESLIRKERFVSSSGETNQNPAAPTAKSTTFEIRYAFAPSQYLMRTESKSEGVAVIDGDRIPNTDRTTHVWRMDVGNPDAKDEKKISMRLAEVQTEGDESGRSYRYDSTGKGKQKGIR